MTKPIDTVLFDFGGTLDADGVAWKERFHTLYRSEGLDMTADAFAPAFFAADDPLVGGLPRAATGLPETVDALTANLEVELARLGAGADGAGTVKDRTDGNRPRRVASRFLSGAVGRFLTQSAGLGGAEATLPAWGRLEFLRQSRSGLS